MKRATLARPISFEGIGIHSGEPVKMEVLPCPASTGVTFKKDGETTLANVKNVTSTARGTTIGKFKTVEHLLSALYACGIDDAEVVMSSYEPPIMDGSSAMFSQMMRSAGVEQKNEDRVPLLIGSAVEIVDGDSSLAIYPADRLLIEAEIVYPATVIGTQTASYDEAKDDFITEVAPARTFGMMSEIDNLLKAGLAKGASFDNAVVITDSGYSSPLRFPNELARHKILDIIGDISLSGRRIAGKIVSRRAGHRHNIELVRRILNG